MRRIEASENYLPGENNSPLEAVQSDAENHLPDENNSPLDVVQSDSDLLATVEGILASISNNTNPRRLHSSSDSGISIPPDSTFLSHEQERILIEAYKYGGDRVQNKVIEVFLIANLRWIYNRGMVISERTGKKVSLGEAMAFAEYCIVKAIAGYDPSRGARVLTFAHDISRKNLSQPIIYGSYPSCVSHRLLPDFNEVNHARNKLKMLWLPCSDENIESFVLMQRTRARIKKELGKTPTDEECLDYLKTVPAFRASILQKVRFVLANPMPSMISLDSGGYQSGEKGGNNPTTLFEILSPQNISNGFPVPPYSSTEEFNDYFSEVIPVRYALDLLPIRLFRVIIYFYYFLQSPQGEKTYTLEETGDLFLLSRERISQLLKKAYAEMRKIFKDRLKGFMSMEKEIHEKEVYFETFLPECDSLNDFVDEACSIDGFSHRLEDMVYQYRHAEPGSFEIPGLPTKNHFSAEPPYCPGEENPPIIFKEIKDKRCIIAIMNLLFHPNFRRHPMEVSKIFNCHPSQLEHIAQSVLERVENFSPQQKSFLSDSFSIPGDEV